MKYLYTLLLLLVLMASSCSKLDYCSDGEKAKFSNGLSFCRPILTLENGDRLEVMNMDDFDIVGWDLSTEILIKYHIINGGSFCQMGAIVELDCLVKQ